MRFHKSPGADRKGAAAAIVASLTVSLLPAQEKQPRLPGDEGRAAVQEICATCHEIETVISSRRTRIGWEQTTEDMIARGAEGSDEKMAAVIEYLAAYFGKINVNTAKAEQLVKSLDLSAVEAQAIAAYRERSGNIKDFEELSKVPGVSAEKLRAKRGLIAFAL